MTKSRKEDPEPRTWFRTDRFIQHGYEWYFATREGTHEGPFNCLADAQARLETYINVVTSGLLPDNHGFAIQPLD